MSLSKNMSFFAAKSDRDGEMWLPLFIHAEDTANVMKYLLHTRYQGLAETCGIEYSLLIKTAQLLAYLHDIGKLTPVFQSKILTNLPKLRDVLEDHGIKIPFESEFIDKSISHHSKCGEFILKKFEFPREIAAVVGAHHGKPADIQTRPPEENIYGRKAERSFRENIYREWADHSLKKAGFGSVEDIPALNKRTQILLCGLLIVSDWLASDESNFPLIDADEFPAEYPLDRFEKAVVEIKLPDAWESESIKITEADFERTFGFSMNEIQKSVVEAAEKCGGAGLFILEAPMGIGKTEAALSAAEILAAKCGKNGLFFGLPTQATANGIFERVKNWAELQSCEGFHSIELVHGSAEFQSEYIKIKENSSRVFSDDSGLAVHPFFDGRKKALLADFAVGTVDRLLMCAFKKKHFMMLHLGVSQKVVIVDECHAYDAYMNRYLDRALSWLHEYGAPVILLSATLPPDRRLALVNAYLRSDLAEDDLPRAEYPRLTYTDKGAVKAVSLSLNMPSKTVRITRKNDESVIEEIRRAVNAGACVGVICNTVARAQSFAKTAREINGADVILYHARFVIPDRIEREEILKKSIGKHSTPEIRNGKVIIGTQVLEQSLDIDFDVLVTDLCPMDLLLQRIGRLHRHQRDKRPLGYETAECIVLGTEELDHASEKMYTKWLLMRSRKLLPDMITLPDEIDKLVCDTYMNIAPESDDEAAALEEYDLRRKEKESMAGAFLMPAPRDGKYNNDLHSLLNNEIEDDDNKATASVRGGDPSIDVIVLVRRNDGGMELLPWHSKGAVYSLGICPPENECRLIAQQKLRLPSIFCQRWNIGDTIKELETADKELVGFQKSHWLRGELFLLLNEELTSELRGFKLTYSQDNGLECIKEE